MRLPKKIFYQSCSLLPLNFLQKNSPVHTLLPYHHTVSDNHLPHIKHLYDYKNIKQFTNDVDILLRHYKPINPDDLLKHIEIHNNTPKQTFLLTFDDGFKEVYDTIAPILEKKGVPAIFFINPAFIDNKELFFRSKISLLIDNLLSIKTNSILGIYQQQLNMPGTNEAMIITHLKSLKADSGNTVEQLAQKTEYDFTNFLNEQKPFLTTDNLNSLKQRGFTIGAHSMTHPNYKLLDTFKQLEQTTDSCNFIKPFSRNGKQYFSFPFSDEDLSQKLFEALKKTDIDLFFGIQNQKTELNNKMLHRFNAERSNIDFKNQIKGILTIAALRNFAGKNSVKRN